MKKPTAWRIVDHGPDHAQYFPGHGTAFTHYTDCATGCGHTPGEALEDALEQLASAPAWKPPRLSPSGLCDPTDHSQDEHWDLSEIEASDDARALRADPRSVDDWHDCATEEDMEGCEHHWYVSIDLKD